MTNTMSMEQKIDALTAQVAYLVEQQEQQQELVDELMLIAKSATSAATDRLSDFEARGYFAHARELAGVLDHVVEGFSPDDVRALGENIVNILNVVRSVTQPKMLGMLDDASRAVDEAGKPMSLLSTLRATRDKDVQRGMAVGIEVLRRVGHGARSVRSRRVGQQNQLAARLGPSRPKEGPTKRIAAPPVTTAKALKPKVSGDAPVEIPGVDIDGEGFLVDSNQWNKDVAASMARSIGLEALTDAHWKVIEYLRTSYAEKGKSPNVRAVSMGADVPIRELYTLFPGAPGKIAARIAGVPKPVGCI